ncbi:MAG: beta-N-acetylhexosaminidase [Cellulosilyticaceae bacterium]
MQLTGELEELQQGLDAIKKLMPFELDDTVAVHKLDDTSEHCLEIHRGDTCTISYQKPHHFFRALSLYLQFAGEEQATFVYSERALIPTCGAMIDVSRNSVYKPAKVKELLVKLALMGHSTCMLYTEDTYELPGYPYFGYLRGAYTLEELKDLDDYAYHLGIELIPCIQTLAHLKQTLKWNYGQKMQDTADVLLVNAPETYAFLEAMFSTLKSTFRTNRIHIGMDEAFDLGRGKSIEANGFKHHNELMVMHLEKVNELLTKYDLQPMMWDDMFLRGSGPHANQFDPNATVDPAIAASVPKNMSLVYWDYYHLEEDFYTMSFHKRSTFSNPVIFAGGVWKWMGYAPHYDKTFITTNAALTACKKYGITEVLATMWGDDGDEAPIDVTMLGLILFAEHCYHPVVEDAWLERRTECLTGLSVEDFMGIQDLDKIPGVPSPNTGSLNPSKYFLYQDVLLGAFDYYTKDTDLYGHYTALAGRFERIAQDSPQYFHMFDMYSKLATVLSTKANIGCILREAYLTNDRSSLENLSENIFPMLIQDIKAFKDSLRTLWYKDCKGHGFEVLDIRLGGVIARCETAISRIDTYLNGWVDRLEELDEERLPFKSRYTDHDDIINYNQYCTLATQNIFSHGI